MSDGQRPVLNISGQEHASIAIPDLVIRRTTGRSLIVKGTLNDQSVNMIVETAAMITLVNEKLMPADFNCAETVTLRGLGDQHVIGRIACETLLEINGIKVHWDVCVVPLDDDAILGIEILDTLGAVINLRILSMTLNSKLTQASFVEGSPSELYQRVYTRRTITVPPNSEMTFSVSTHNNIDQEFIIAPTPMTTGVLISHAVGKGRQCPITLINDGNRFVKIKKGTHVGYLEEIETVEEVEQEHYEVFNVDSSKGTTRCPQYQVLSNICLTCQSICS